VAESGPKSLGGFLLTLADLAAIDDHVVIVSDAVDADRTERERLKPDTFRCLYCFHVSLLKFEMGQTLHRERGFSHDAGNTVTHKAT
jgi:hypothetical protein